MIDVQTRTEGEVHIVELTGKLHAAAGHLFWEAVQDIVVNKGGRQLIVNFGGVSECDSYGISEMLRVHRSIANIGGQMVLTNLNDLIRKVFHITKVDSIFLLVDTEAEALKILDEASVFSA